MTLQDLQRSLETLLPEGVRGSVAAVDAAAGTAVYEEERQLTGNMSQSRRLECLAGRDCARRALADFEVGPAAILRDGRGLPVWPPGYVGSITHCKGLCGAAVARIGDHAMLGLDIERTDRLSAAAMKRVVHPVEAAWVAGEQWRASLLFSLKEAFYKAQFPGLEIAANFHDLGLEIDLDGGRAGCREVAPHLEGFANSLSARGGLRFVRSENQVVSLCWLRAPE